jgi:hypothetical protein
MSPHQDPLTDWIQKNWTPSPTQADAFETGLGRRREAHQRRRRIGTGSVLLLMAGLGFWTFSPSPAVVEIPAITIAAEATESFWDGTLMDTQQTPSIPDDYEALAGFFLADS